MVYVGTEPIKTKTTKEVSDVFKDKISTKEFINFQGTEFYNRCFSELLRRYNFKHYSTVRIKKAAIVERLIRTLKPWLHNEFSARGNSSGLTSYRILLEFTNTPKLH